MATLVTLMQESVAHVTNELHNILDADVASVAKWNVTVYLQQPQYS